MTQNGDIVGCVPLWLDNKALPIDHSRLHPVIHAQSGQKIHEYQSAIVDDALKAVESAGKAFKTYKNTTILERRAILNKFANIIERDADKFMKLQQDETSTSTIWARNNVNAVVNYSREIAGIISTMTGSIPQIDKPDTMGFVFKEPIGKVLLIPPWNGALVLAARGMAMAIAAGCTLVVKASELCPATHQALTEAWHEAGLPSGVMNKIQAARQEAAQVTEALIAHPAIRKVEFIGSAAVGRIIGSVAAKHLKPVLMELGGKCPAIVLDDANLEQAAELCAKGALMNHGQICFSTERIIVHKKVAADFKKHVVEAFKKNSPIAGSGVTDGIVAHAHEVLLDAQKHGAEFLVGGPEYVNGDSKASLKPSLIFQPNKDARIRDEETFGPSASLYEVSSDEEAIDVANDSSYGLNACVHTTNMERGLKMAKELEYGQVHINSISVYTAATGPQGGVKGSGWGRQNTTYGLEEFYQTKFVSYHGGSGDNPSLR